MTAEDRLTFYQTHSSLNNAALCHRFRNILRDFTEPRVDLFSSRLALGESEGRARLACGPLLHAGLSVERSVRVGINQQQGAANQNARATYMYSKQEAKVQWGVLTTCCCL